MENKKRLRINGTFRWTEQQTKDLVASVFENVKANPEQFEKPTAQKFYYRIKENSPNLCNIKWDIMRTKMRHLKKSLTTAIKWKGQTGAGLLESGDVKSVEEYIQKTCPFYDQLYGIFGRRVNIQPPAIYQTSNSVVSLENNWSLSREIDLESSESSPESLFDNPPVISSPTLSDNQATASCTLASYTCTQSNIPTPTTTTTATTATATTTTTPKRNLKRPNSSSPFALLFDIQKKKVDLEAQKLELEKEKEENQFKLQKLQLEKEERIEMEKLRLEHERLKSANI